MDFTLSFCITCKNRFWQIRQTLPKNLFDNRMHKNFVDFILVDFGSRDGLQEWILDEFDEELSEGYLKYFYTDDLKEWHASIAKNTAHILSDHFFVVNLDCDNYTGERGGEFVIASMLKYGVNDTIIHQFNNEYKSGTYGRIAMTRTNFLSIGGYDESFEPMMHEDADIIKRLFVSGRNYIHLVDREYNQAIPNEREDSFTNITTNLSWEEMKHINRQASLKNITSGKLVANADKQRIGVENIYCLTD